ncbi:MAG: gliding motility protein GldN [Desulfobacteraceae bacterium]|nr:gliding motility protein GldN [Desulfobacteraceae bacterium]
MKKILFFVFISLFFVLVDTNEANSQVLDGIYEKEHVPSRTPAPYTFLREADVMWQARIWRMIDLREKINHPLYYPAEKIGDRLSLIDLLLWGINNEGVVPYDPVDDRFTAPMTRADIDAKFDALDDTTNVPDPVTGDFVEVIIPGDKTTSEVKQYILKEDWFFDNQKSVMEVRIIGICPIRHYVKDDGTGGAQQIRESQVFWIYFPDARRVLANHEVFNRFNDAERKTFDDIFLKRRFGSFVIRESNVYEDRGVSEYRIGIQSISEAEKIKDKIFKFEHDLWEY